MQFKIKNIPITNQILISVGIITGLILLSTIAIIFVHAQPSFNLEQGLTGIQLKLWVMKLMIKLALIILLMMGILGGIIYFFLKSLSGSITKFTLTVQRSFQNQLQQKVPICDHELKPLSLIFNEIIEEIYLLNKDYQNIINQLEIAEISAQSSYLELQEEKEKLEKIKQELEKASQAKSMFLANMSHELR
ncbi:MAG TPA: hypothetical protein V6C58_04310, partial [Allocoleopsis sp.]